MRTQHPQSRVADARVVDVHSYDGLAAHLPWGVAILIEGPEGLHASRKFGAGVDLVRWFPVVRKVVLFDCQRCRPRSETCRQLWDLDLAATLVVEGWVGDLILR